jgi:Putative addiction module component
VSIDFGLKPEQSASSGQVLHWREIRAKLIELDRETWFNDGDVSEQEKAIIEARLDEYDRNPDVGSSWAEAKARILADLHGE